MRITIAAAGMLRAGPEADLVKDYIGRFDAAGRQLGLGPAQIIEIDPRKHRDKQAETAALLAVAPKGARRIALDERGGTLKTPDFANKLARWRDDGVRDTAFLIGGADGLDPAARQQADLTLSFGPMVWPHMLVRVMLAEQLYRAASILAGSPYHRA